MKCLAFDLGKVIFDFDYDIGLDKIKDKLGVSQDRVIHTLFYEDFTLDFERGLVSCQDFYKEFVKKFKANLGYEEFIDIWCNIFSPKLEMVDLVRRARLIYPTYLISNINKVHFEHLKNSFGEIFSFFDDLILSFEVKAVKPQREIYEVLRKKAQTTFDSIVYIDDREELINEAKKLGLRCIKFISLPQLVGEMEFYNVFIPSGEESITLERLKEKIDSNQNNFILVGIGNVIREDDSVGSLIMSSLKEKVSFKVYDAGNSLENHLDKLAHQNNRLIVFVDCAYYDDDSRFKLFSPQMSYDLNLYFTHNSSLKLAIQYLQEYNRIDILILGIRGNRFGIGEALSRDVYIVKEILESFFLRHYSKGGKFK
ncbi:MAG: hydrogenase maturation protease [Candidatus Omnitrophica bacterium]|nr:hydrogenase maturation protease [Candidatus Omnitrophota bacterium]MCM8826246.1 hydrogenase maturation protease [Candidatus Omnitrophota bacterium]